MSKTGILCCVSFLLAWINSSFKVLRTQVPWTEIEAPKSCQICHFPMDFSNENLVFCTQEHYERYQRSLKSTRVKTRKSPPQDIAWKPMEIVSDEENDNLGIDISGIDLNQSRVEQDESTEGEQYTKSVGDRTFQKFVRRIERAPDQILRFDPMKHADLDTYGLKEREELFYIAHRQECYLTKNFRSARNVERIQMLSFK